MLTKHLKLTLFLFGILSSFFCYVQKQKTNLVLTEENHNEYYNKGVKLIDAVTSINQNNFAAFWVKGKGYQALEEHESAYTEFRKSFQLKKDNPDVARELILECLSLGNGKEAVEVSLHTLTLDSNNSGLVANLALSYLINGDLDLSSKNIDKAIELDPNDKINYNLKKVIDEVITGKRKQPKKYDDLNK